MCPEKTPLDGWRLGWSPRARLEREELFKGIVRSNSE